MALNPLANDFLKKRYQIFTFYIKSINKNIRKLSKLNMGYTMLYLKLAVFNEKFGFSPLHNANLAGGRH